MKFHIFAIPFLLLEHKSSVHQVRKFIIVKTFAITLRYASPVTESDKWNSDVITLETWLAEFVLQIYTVHGRWFESVFVREGSINGTARSRLVERLPTTALYALRRLLPYPAFYCFRSHVFE